MDRRQPGADDARERIQGYLDRSGLAAGKPRVVPLTGDASDRRYFRILLPDSDSIVLALNAAPFDVTKLPFVNVATLLAKMPVPIPAVLGHADDLGLLALQDLGDVTLQAHLGAASPAEHAALYRQAVALLRDSYVHLPEQTVDDLIASFRALRGVTAPAPPSRRRFDVMALQRTLKPLGTFGYQTPARRNPVYIQYIPRTLRYVRNNLENQPRFERLHDLLATHVEEFR